MSKKRYTIGVISETPVTEYEADCDFDARQKYADNYRINIRYTEVISVEEIEEE